MSPAEEAPREQSEDDDDGSDHQADVEGAVLLLPKRVEPHASTVDPRPLIRSRPVSVTAMPWISTRDDGPIRRLILTNPSRKNAVPPGGWEELREAIEDFEGSDARVLVIRGEGEDFCAGANLDPGMAGDNSVVARHRRMKSVAAAATALHRATKPTMAAVDGVAVGAGMNLALGCDLVIATSRARFSEIFVKRGLTMDFGGSWLLPRIVGLQRAKELALSGRIVEADEACQIGLCLEVVEPDEIDARVMELATSLAEGAPLAQTFIKQTIDAGWGMPFAEALAYEGQAQSICFATEDFTEGVAGFLEKRPPRFVGR